MLSKNQIKSVTALHHKKFRKEENLFIAEGIKVVTELLMSGSEVLSIYGTQEFFNKLGKSVRISKQTEIILVDDHELKKISALTTPQHVIAIAGVPNASELNYESGLKLIADGISDPGNFGTLLRIADWFGVEEIICSPDTVDCYNPKVVQSAMGSLFRTNVIYEDLSIILNRNKSEKNLPVYGTVLEEKNIYDEDLNEDAFILIGNESTGISENVLSFITHSITIPSFGKAGAESLNVAVATGIVFSEFRRKQKKIIFPT